MKRETIEKLEAHFQESHVLRGEPATNAAIEASQRRLNCRFDADYIEFLQMFGCGLVGPNPIFGIGTCEAMGVEEDVVRQTKHYRMQRWPGVDDWYIVSEDGRGNPIGIGSDGKVRLSDHDVGDVTVVAESFEGFLLERLQR